MPVTEEDLKWWLAVSRTLPWRWAKTYADTAPHWYVLRDAPGGLSPEDYERAVKVIWTFGRPEKFYSRLNINLHDTEGEFRWFTSDGPLDDALINRAPADVTYGEQDAPSTGDIDHLSIYDTLSVEYDSRYDREHCEGCQAENLAVWKHVMGDRHIPSLLDVGAGTGLALDLKMVRKGHGEYRAVDPAHGMLNRLVYKHQWVRDVWPLIFEDYLEQHDGRTFDTVLSLFGSPSYIHPEAIGKLPDLAETMLVLMHYLPGYRPDYHTDETWPEWADESRQAAAELPGAEVTRLNNFQIVTVR